MGCYCAKDRKNGQDGSMDAENLFEDISFLLKVPLFAFLGREELPRLALAFDTSIYCIGEVVVAQGEQCSQFYVIKYGSASVTTINDQSEEQVAELVRGDYFGEEALLQDRPNAATVTATDILQVLVLERSEFERLDLRHKLHFKKRMAVVEGKSEEVSRDPQLLRKTAEEHAMLRQALTANKNLKPILDKMALAELDFIVDHAFAMPVEAGDVIVSQGELKADLFYMVGRGTFEVIVSGKSVLELGPGGSFGELALLYRAPRAATVKATANGILWAVPRQHFRQVGKEQLRIKLAEFMKLLDRVELLKELSNEQKGVMADALLETTYYKDAFIAKEGDSGSTFFILYQGAVAVEIGGKLLSDLSADPSQGTAEFFGERTLLTDCRQATSVRVTSEKAMVLALDRDTFKKVLAGAEAGAVQIARRLSTMPRVIYSLDRLDEVGLLGSGAFGKVTLVRDRELKSIFALKAVSKGLVVHMQQIDAVKREKLVLQTTLSPFLVRLAATFVTDQFLYFLMEAAIGGELFTVYRRQNLFGKEAHARFYTACTLRGLEHMHERGIIYRDLKPENLLLDSVGYCKITDFGLATFTLGHTYTLCGTPEYMAPEIIAGMGYTCSADWWSLGVFTFECMMGLTPFVAEDVVNIFHRVQCGMDAVLDHLTRPDHQNWVALVRELCKMEPSERLPMRIGGIQNLMEQEWFSSCKFDWKAHKKRKMEAPYVPEVKNRAELTHFDASEQENPDCMHYADSGADWEDGFAEQWGPRFN